MNDHVTGKAGDLQLERQFAALRPELLRFAAWLARDRAIAEDVVQETLLGAWKSRDSLDGPARLRAWPCTIASREHAGMYERKRLPTTDVDLRVAADDPALAAGEEQRLGELRAAILRLSQPAVLTRLFRARDKLRGLYGLAPRGAGAAEDSGAGREQEC